MSEKRRIVKSKVFEDGSGSAHLLIESIGSLSAGNDFNWWNLVIIEPQKSVDYVRQGRYGVYAARGKGVVTYSAPSRASIVQKIAANHVSQGANDPIDLESKIPGVFGIKITNESSDEILVAFVLLAIDPGTTPGIPKSSP